MSVPTLIYCADGNQRFAEIAIRRGYKYGAQLPNTIYFDPHFADQAWKTPNRPGYMAALAKYRPALASVLDWEREEQLSEVLEWAEEAAQHVTDSVIIIPKVIGGINRLPRTIGGKSVRLGYSAATTFAGTPVSLGEFRGWPVHCLGGSPVVQMDVARKTDCHSADGNYIQNMARRNCHFYCPGSRSKHNNWPTLREAGLYIAWNAPYAAFELTCIAVPMAWAGYSGADIYEAQMSFISSIGMPPAITQKRMFS